ncbi:hypothetical protein BDF20DRAFT_883643 [Mycotypha africana]|uniref:uncharacterized protein n=1 Tax=Mycotypha africana TaxID=64632 RepID=UPI0022FFF682|nr:uncharacterized protein BDF20DRAFT_883643 [Mycotypha africana]KAI8973693.1 hypothetical protein BDF20DRAFT_883643 [Mycotypha africana]
MHDISHILCLFFEFFACCMTDHSLNRAMHHMKILVYAFSLFSRTVTILSAFQQIFVVYVSYMCRSFVVSIMSNQ